MTTILRFRSGDLAGVYDLDDPETPAAVTLFWQETGGQVGEIDQGYLLAGLFETGLDEQRGEVIPADSSLALAVMLGERGPLTAPLRARVVGGPLM